jgi:MATE family multidrug resistance protein
MGLCLAGAPAFFLRLYAATPEVIRIGTPLLYCSAAFQIFDGIQAALGGALRGRGETQRPFLINVLGYWLIGLPVGVYLAFWRGWRATGLWLGFIAGLAVVALLLVREWERPKRRRS